MRIEKMEKDQTIALIEEEINKMEESLKGAKRNFEVLMGMS